MKRDVREGRDLNVLLLLSFLAMPLGCGPNIGDTQIPANGGARPPDLKQSVESVVWPSALPDSVRIMLLQRYNAQSETVMAVWADIAMTEIAAVLRSESGDRALRVDVWVLPVGSLSAPVARSEPASGEAEVELVFYGHVEGFSFPAILGMVRVEDDSAFPVFFARLPAQTVVEQLQSAFGDSLAGLQTPAGLRLLRRASVVCAFSAPDALAPGNRLHWFRGESNRLVITDVQPDCVTD